MEDPWWSYCMCYWCILMPMSPRAVCQCDDDSVVWQRQGLFHRRPHAASSRYRQSREQYNRWSTMSLKLLIYEEEHAT
ncbi:hypothetical protein DFH94DRAFT_773137 [Russula ochroleuca]|uniref:Secreted protein n=1 Tax=Russula ochroleuca TaxID=152965 RepID=A0A9P5MM45_9AGAM|nr:hypothetical protein DFH94DRAFT_773137 [Russula ochroleuca]